MIYRELSTRSGVYFVYRKCVKRLLDVMCAFVALLVFSPIMLTVSVMIRLKMGSPVLFVQERIGLQEHPFKIIKFRTMSSAVDQNGKLLPDRERLSSFGMFLRSSSIDELPALLNIVKGEMSFIGPRPLPVKYLPFFYTHERVRHEVRGGLSGLAQINGRNTIGWEERFAFDAKYVENLKFRQDVSIFFKTIEKVFKRENIGIRGETGLLDFHIYRQEKLDKS